MRPALAPTKSPQLNTALATGLTHAHERCCNQQRHLGGATVECHAGKCCEALWCQGVSTVEQRVLPLSVELTIMLRPHASSTAAKCQGAHDVSPAGTEEKLSNPGPGLERHPSLSSSTISRRFRITLWLSLGSQPSVEPSLRQRLDSKS